jgi:hypothetical protein
MLNGLRKRVTYANVVASTALFVALGGSSYAAVKVTGRDIADNTVASANITDHTIQTRDIKTGAINSADVRDGSLQARDFRGGLPSGQLGATGATGAPGADGQRGPSGQDGADGATGPSGMSASATAQVYPGELSATSQTLVAHTTITPPGSPSGPGAHLIVNGAMQFDSHRVVEWSARCHLTGRNGLRTSYDVSVAGEQTVYAPVPLAFSLRTELVETGVANTVDLWCLSDSAGAISAGTMTVIATD